MSEEARETSNRAVSQFTYHVYENCKEVFEEQSRKGYQCRFLTGYIMKGHKRFDGRGEAILKKLIEERKTVKEPWQKISEAAELVLKGEDGLRKAF